MPLGPSIYYVSTFLFHSVLPNERADQNKRVWIEDFFFIYYLHQKGKYGGKIYHLLHKKLKVCMVEKHPKNLSKYVCSFIREFRVHTYFGKYILKVRILDSLIND